MFHGGVMSQHRRTPDPLIRWALGKDNASPIVSVPPVAPPFTVNAAAMIVMAGIPGHPYRCEWSGRARASAFSYRGLY